MRTVVFLSGFVVMAAELLAGRLLVPQFGDSIVVWGSIIGCFLLSMSAGYWFGGVIADKKVRFALFGTLLVLALSVILMYGLAQVSYPHPLLAAFILTVLPGFAGGAIMPLVLTHDAKSLKNLGVTAGVLSAWSTIGSVLGTFAVIFVFLPFLGVFKTTLFLVLLGLITLGLLNKWFFLFAVLLPLLFISSSHSETEIVDVTIESPYGPVRVYDGDTTRHLIINGGQMSEMNLSNPTQDLPYWDYLVCMNRWLAGVDDMYVMGLGAGSLTLRAQEQNINVVAVDINPVVVDVAQEYFTLEEDDTTTLHVADGRVHLREQEKTFDLITMDVMHYNNHSYELPPHLITQEFFTEAQTKLNTDGVLIIHVLTYPEHELAAAVATTLDSVFTHVSQMDCQGSQIIAASNSELASWPETIEPFSGALITDDKTPIFLG